jgi:gluconolactonase
MCSPLIRCFLAVVLSFIGFGCVTSSVTPFAVGERPLQVMNVKHAGEGPAWNRVTKRLYYVGDDRISQFVCGKYSRDYRRPVLGANGLLIDHQGRLVACEAGNRRVTRTERDGRISVLAEFYQGMRLNSPNDLSIDSKDRLYFTDPRYGPRDSMEMTGSDGVLVEGVYRIDAPGKVVRILGRDAVNRPNGILVSPDEKYLYVADNNNSLGGVRKLWRFDLDGSGAADPRSRKLIFDWKTSRGPDGMKMDSAHRLYVAAGLNRDNLPAESAKPYTGGVYVLSETGRLIDFVPIPKDEVTNCAFGGEDLRTLYITAGGTLWSIRVDVPGLVTF